MSWFISLCPVGIMPGKLPFLVRVLPGVSPVATLLSLVWLNAHRSRWALPASSRGSVIVSQEAWLAVPSPSGCPRMETEMATESEKRKNCKRVSWAPEAGLHLQGWLGGHQVPHPGGLAGTIGTRGAVSLGRSKSRERQKGAVPMCFYCSLMSSPCQRMRGCPHKDCPLTDEGQQSTGPFQCVHAGRYPTLRAGISEEWGGLGACST